nr:glutathione S-transferase family protein [Aromatoleum diolicum]
MVKGDWVDQWYDTATTGGAFVRGEAQFRNWVTADGRPGPSGTGGFPAEAGRYHLYVSLACPWAHRTLIFRALKGLEPMIGVSVVNPFMGNQGWSFEPGPGVVADPLHHAAHLHELYRRANPAYTGRVTVPVLWDRQRDTIVSNESADIIRMFNTAFDGLGAKPGDYAPADLMPQIDALNARIYETINNGVYRAGFATGQSAYEAAVTALFGTLDELEERLASNRYLLGERITETDWRLFTTLIRFDAVYHGHFKCNVRRLMDYPNLLAWTRELYQWPGVAATVDFAHIKAHYYRSHHTINPTGIVPAGPVLDLLAPHGRSLVGS